MTMVADPRDDGGMGAGSTAQSSTAQNSTAQNSTARRAMIDSQLRTSGVNRPDVLRAMGVVERRDYLPEARRGSAYIDRAIPLDDGGALPAPVVQGKLLELADIAPGDSVLVIDNGSGYLAALVEVLGGKVTRGEAGAVPGRGTFDLILIDGAAEELPADLARRLAPEGRIVTGIVERGVTRLATGRLAGKRIALLPVADIGIPTIAAFAAKPTWSF